MGSNANPCPRAWRDGKAVRVHRLLAEEALGRELEGREVVHHRNGDKTNNICVLPSQRYHMVLEHLERRRVRGIEALFADDEILERLEK